MNIDIYNSIKPKLQQGAFSLDSEDIDFLTKFPIKFIDDNFADYIWGGYNLYNIKSLSYNKNARLAAESWEVSGHEKYPSRVLMPDGRIFTLIDLLKDSQLADLILGNSVVERFGRDFPILAKLIDVHQHMSVHLHPSHEMAKILGEKEQGKEELFIVIGLHENAESALYLGLKDGVTSDVFESAIKNEENILDLLHKIYVSPGDIYRIPSGVPHCWTGGSIAVEITENSNITYRLYDFLRQRPMHIKKGLASIDYKCKQGIALEKDCRGQWQPTSIKGIDSVLTYNALRVERLSVGISDNPIKICKRDTFGILIAVEGIIEIASLENSWSVLLHKGNSLLIPAYAGDYLVKGVGQINNNCAFRIGMKIPRKSNN